MAISYRYALLTYCPDRIRQERINVGVVVFLPTDLDIRLLNSAAKSRAIGASLTPEKLREAASMLPVFVDFQTSPEEQHEDLRLLNSELAISDKLGLLTIDHPNEYERLVQSVFDRFVKPVSPPRRMPRSSTKFYADLKDYFRTHKILGRDETDIDRHILVPRYPIVEADNLYADYVLRNGIYHVTQTLDYEKGSARSKFHQSATVAVTLDQSRRKFGNESRLHFLYNATFDREPEIRAHLNLIGDYADQVLNFQSASDFSSYIEEIMKAASDTRQITEFYDASNKALNADA